MDRRKRPLGRGSLSLSVAIHAVALAALWAPGFTDDVRVYETIQIRVVSAPPTAGEEQQEVPPVPEEELVVETPEEPEPVAEEEAPVVVEQEPEPEPEPQETPPPPEETPPPPVEPPAPARTETDEPGERGGEDLDVRLEGLRRDYPDYYANIIRQMQRCFRPTPGQSRQATVSFLIHRDGKTSDFRMVESSGSLAFDIEAQGAVECAGRPGRVGPLPQDFPWDALPIQFTFRPRRR